MRGGGAWRQGIPCSAPINTEHLDWSGRGEVIQDPPPPHLLSVRAGSGAGVSLGEHLRPTTWGAFRGARDTFWGEALPGLLGLGSLLLRTAGLEGALLGFCGGERSLAG